MIVIEIRISEGRLLWWILITVVTFRFDLLKELLERVKSLTVIKKKLMIPYKVKFKWERK